MNNYDSREDTLEHIFKVRHNIAVILQKISERSYVHDASKLEDPEKSTFDKVTPRLKGLTYGSDEYKASLVTMQGALDHHYANNRHHPEHFEDGIKGMTLVDLIEMFCDWCAATERHADGDIFKSIKINKERFQYGDVLEAIFKNTASRLDMGKKGETYENSPDQSK